VPPLAKENCVRLPVYKLKLVRSGWIGFPRIDPKHPQLAAYFFHKLIAQAAVEHAAVLFLDQVQRPVGASVISVGDLGRVPMMAREVFKAAILTNASSVIVAHNHPAPVSPEPSPADIRVTRRLIRAGEIIGIPLLDHIILTPNGEFSSMRERVELLLWWPPMRETQEPQAATEERTREGNL
jgi:DNA repair protein RadC